MLHPDAAGDEERQPGGQCSPGCRLAHRGSSSVGMSLWKHDAVLWSISRDATALQSTGGG